MNIYKYSSHSERLKNMHPIFKFRTIFGVIIKEILLKNIY